MATYEHIVKTWFDAYFLKYLEKLDVILSDIYENDIDLAKVTLFPLHAKLLRQ